MPDPRQKLYKALSSKFDLGTQDEFNSKMDNPESRKKLFNAVSSKFDLGSFEEFESKVAPVKKKETSNGIAPEKKSVSVQNTGSLGGKATQGFPQIDTNSVAPGMGVQPTAETAQAKEKRLRKELANVKVTPENMDQVMADTDALSASVKQNKKAAEQAKSARVKKLETSFYAATQNNDDAIEADKRLNDKLNNKGFVNNIVSASKSAFNTVLGAVASTSPTLAGLAFMGVNEDPLADEKKLAKKEALKNNEKLSDDQINERAKEIFKEKEKENLFIDRANSFLDDLDAEDRNLLKQDRYDKGIHLQEDNVKRLKYNAALQTVAEDKIKEYQSIESQLKKLESNKQPFPEELYAKYTALSGEIKNLSSTIKKNQDYIQKNKKDLGTTEQEFDLFKREYGDLYNFASNFSVSAGELALNTLSGLEYLGTLGGNIGDDKKNQGVQNDLNAAQQDLKQERDKLRKSVESIESGEGLLNYASDLLANQIPNLLATSTGAKGLAMVGTASAGQKYTEMAEEVRQGKASYTPLQMAFSPLLYGGAEVISEIPTLSILKNGGRVFESIAKNETQLIAKTAKQKAIEWSKDYGIDMSKEMAGEQFTNFTQNFNDKYVLGKKDVNLLDNTGRVFKDTFTLTSILKAAPHTFGVIAKPFQSKKDLGVLDENSRKIIEFSQQLNTQGLTDTEKNAIQKQIDKATTESSKIVANTIGSIENMPGELYDEVISLNSKAGEIKAQAKAINDGKLPNKKDLLKGLAEDYKALQEQRSAIIDGKTTVVDVLPLQEQEILKRQAMEDLVTELNPDGTKNITITNEQVVERANKIFAESKANESTTTQTSTPTSTEEAAPSVTIPPIPEDYNIVDPQPKTEVNLPLSPTESQQNGKKVEGNSPQKIELTDEDKAIVQKKVVEEPRVLLRRGAVGEDAFFALPNEGIYGEVVDKVGADQDYTAYQYPEDFKIKDLSNDVVFDDYMSNKMFEQTKEEGYDAAYVMEIDGSKVLHVINPGKLTLLDEKLPELRDNKKQPVVEQTTPDTKAQPSEVAPSVSESQNQKDSFGNRLPDNEKRFDIKIENNLVGEIVIASKKNTEESKEADYYEVVNANVTNTNKGIGTEAYEKLIALLDKPLYSDIVRTPQAERVWQKLEEKGLAVKSQDGLVYESTLQKNEASSPSNNPADGNVRPRVNNVEEVREANGNSNKGESVQNSVDGRENQGENEVNDVAKKTGIKASNLRDLYKINQKVFGQNRVKALAAAIVMDRMIGSMAKRAKVSKSEIYSKLDFKKGDKKTFEQLSKNGKALFQIVGTNAKLSKNIKENLKVARTMEAAGKNSQEIRVVTGWEKGADGKWGYEIDDSKVTIKNEIQSGQKLSDLLDHPELFEMYPELGNVSIVVNNRMDFSAVAIAESNKILINETANTDPKELKATILHEVQHLIQYKEGWSLGATPDAIRQKLNEAANNNSKIKSSVKKIIRTVFSKQTGLMIDDVKAKKLLGKQDFELYLSLSGETQSRNVESRMDFTSEERRNATLESTEDVRREEQIVLFQEGKGAVEIAEDGQAVIYALTDPNISTPLHELAHVYEQYLTATDKKTILEWSKQKEWTRETSENFAKGFEKYLADGIAPTAELQKIFEKFKDWLTEVYEGIKDSEIDLEISPKMQNVYAKMLGEKAVNLQNPKNEKNGKQKTNSGTKEKGDAKNNDIDSKTKNGGSQNEGSSKAKRISLKGRTPLTKRKFRGDRAKANNIQPVDAKSLVLQYFIGGGRVTKEAILKLYRGSENEFKARTKIGGYAFENSGKSIDEIAHDIWERRGDVDVDTSDIKEAVEAVISEHSRISSMVQDMLTYEDMQPVDDINQLEEDQQMFEEVQEEFAATPEEMQTAINLLDQLTDDEIIRLAEEKELSFEQFIEDLDARQVTFDMGPFVGERGTLLDNGNIVSENGDLILSNQVSNVKKIERNDDPNANGIDEISNEQNRKKELTNERVSYEKRTPKNAPKKLSEIIKAVSSGLRSHLIYSRPKKSNVLGTYNPRNTLVRITRAGDIDTVAHELGHLLDDRFDLLGTISKGVEIAILRQLKWYSDRGGSNPPAAASDSQKREYLQREGLAEFIRSYIANPSQTKIIAPELLAHFENTIDAKTKAVLDQFSDDYLDLANASAIEKTLSNVEEIDLPNKNKFIEWLKSFRKSEDKLSFTAMDKFYAEMANSNHFGIKAFKTLLAMQGKTDVKSSENFEIMSRLFSGINGKLENIFAQGMINAKNERLKAEGGVFTKNSKGRTEYKDGTAMNVAWLVNGLDTTSEETLKKDMNEVIAMAVAERTIEYAKKFGRTDNLTGAGAGIETDLSVAINTLNEFENLKKTDKAKYDRINDGVKRYRQMADATLQYAVDKGRISQEQYKQIKASNEYYVALNRNKELQPGDDLFSSFNTGTNGIGAAKEIIKKAKGGTNTIENPYLSLLRNMNNIIKEADRNEVMLSFVEPLISTRRMGEGEPIDLSKIGFLANDGDAETIKVFRNGKLEKWKFDEEIFKSLKNIESVASNPIMDIISSPSKLIRWTVTHNPVFYARNIVKDTQARMIISNNHSTFVDMIHNSGDKELFELFGGSQAGHLHTSKESYAKTMKGTIKEITKKGGIVLSPKMLADKYMKFLQTGENLNRIAEFNAAYKVAKKQGMNDYDAGLYAAFQARDLMDFAVAGHTMREINKIIVFSNAGVQSIRKASKSLKKDPAGFAYRTALYSVIPSVAFALLRNMMGDDEEYENLPDNQRDMFFNFKTAATGDAWVSIPKPYELGLTSAFVDRAVSKVRGNDQAFDGIMGTTMKTLMPFDESSFLGGLKPIIETQMNRNTYTDRSIVPEWESGKLLELRKGVENASLISQKTSNLFKKAGWSVDPRNIDHILRGYGTYFANQGMAISDLAKDDRAELNFWITKSGFAKDIPTYNAKSVKKATELAVEIGKVNSKPMKSLRDNIEKFYEETNLVKRKEILKEIYAKSEDLIKKFEEDKVEILNKEKRPD